MFEAEPQMWTWKRPMSSLHLSQDANTGHLFLHGCDSLYSMCSAHPRLRSALLPHAVRCSVLRAQWQEQTYLHSREAPLWSYYPLTLSIFLSQRLFLPKCVDSDVPFAQAKCLMWINNAGDLLTTHGRTGWWWLRSWHCRGASWSPPYSGLSRLPSTSVGLLPSGRRQR
jgi:hypothetical protein